ncbi:MAG: O-antigen ligase family protein [Bacteriovorax sp.]|nr:O-antigen ligase family protein [Bacteriovorax sp.]
MELYALKFKDIFVYVKSQGSLFWLINIYLFFEYVRPQTLYPIINVIPFTKLILLLALGILFLRGKFSPVKNTINSLLFLFLLVIVFSSAFALSPNLAFSNVADFIAWLVIFFLIINIVNTENKFLVFMLAFLIYSFKMSQHSFKGWALGGFSFSKDGSGGGPGWFNNSGEFGIQMCVLLALSWYFFVALKENWSKWKKWVFFLFPFTALTGTISCSSRGALVGSCAVLLTMLLKTKYKIKGVVVLTIVLTLIYLLVPDTQMNRFRSSGTDNTSKVRLEMWERGVDLANHFPVLGVGFKNWGIAQQRIYGLDSMLLPHNIFIECASELGYLGLFVFFLLILYTFINNHQTRRLALQNDPENKFIFNMAHGLDCALVGYLVGGFFVTVLYYPYFWINLAMTVALNNIAKKQLINEEIDTISRED